MLAKRERLLGPVIYALVDPRTGDIRYIGKSKNSTDRATYEHWGKVDRSNLHKERWVRGLRQAGLRYGVAILQRPPLKRLNRAEQRWIARGKSLEWPLTNMQDGGEGGVALNRKPIPDAEIVEAYRAGSSVLALAKKHGVNRWTIVRRLNEARIELRGGSEANRIRLAKMSFQERQALTEGAHRALRGTHYKRTGWQGKRIR